MKKLLQVFCWLLLVLVANKTEAKNYLGNDAHIRYMGRVQLVGNQPRLWTGAAYLNFRFKGDTAMVVLEDEIRYGVQHNYIEIQVDDEAPIRLRLNHKVDTIYIIPKHRKAFHDAIVCKDTETGIGYVGVNEIIANELLKAPKNKKWLFEFYGDSITCGASSDTSAVGCHQGRWEDQHNGYMSYGAQLARKEDADWILSSVSGIGLMHSCCDMKIDMRQVWKTMDMREDSIAYHFEHKPNVVFVCLGQNDGVQDAKAFAANYVSFLQQLRTQYKKQPIVLLSSPMADATLREFLRKEIQMVLNSSKAVGIKNLHFYVFEDSYNAGCDFHPSVAQHTIIANKIYDFLKTEKGIL